MFRVLSLNDIAIIIGIIISIATFIINWIYKRRDFNHKKNLREQYYAKHYSDEIRTSKTGLEIIGNAESCIREPYYCPANILTVGIGSTGSVEQKRYTDRVKGCYLFSSNYSC